MAAQSIPLFNDPEVYTLEVDMDGTLYSLRISWNERANCWFMDLYLPTQDASVAVALQCPLVCGYLLTLGVWTNAPKGQLCVIGERDPQRYDWDGRAKLIYIPLADLV